ncbi:secreted RxLR effector protein 161-like [Rutidosis leptorrhynchoides]|uniref:secreted RxLR effector protein 161-like n=1 Tax=Rutidosis leptorrhynchoides TaxID=125765 RepID=UPI003A99AD22
MSSLGAINFFLGLQVDQTEKGIFLHQSKYVADILSRFKIEDERIAKNPLWVNHMITPKNTGAKVNPTIYRAIIGSLMYLTASRPDIMLATCLCFHYQAQLNVNHMLAAKKIMRYLKGTPSLGLWYPCKYGFDLTAYSDSDYGDCKRDFKSTFGGFQFLGSMFVSWQCKKQTAVAQSTCEAKYIAAASCMSQVVWIQQQLRYYETVIWQQPVAEVAVVSGGEQQQRSSNNGDGVGSS